MNWNHVDYLWINVIFLSAVWTHSDGTHPFTVEDPFESKWFKILQIYFDEKTN